MLSIHLGIIHAVPYSILSIIICYNFRPQWKIFILLKHPGPASVAKVVRKLLPFFVVASEASCVRRNSTTTHQHMQLTLTGINLMRSAQRLFFLHIISCCFTVTSVEAWTHTLASLRVRTSNESLLTSDKGKRTSVCLPSSSRSTRCDFISCRGVHWLRRLGSLTVVRDFFWKGKPLHFVWPKYFVALDSNLLMSFWELPRVGEVSSMFMWDCVSGKGFLLNALTPYLISPGTF